MNRPAIKQTKKRRWLISAAACLTAVAVMCTAVPPVRAAILQWFQVNFSVQNYLAKPSEARPSTSDLDAVIQQTKPSEALTVKSIEIVNVDPEWQSWAQTLHPTMGDMFYDGKQLMVSFNMGGGAKEFVIGDTKQPVQGDTADKYPITIRMGDPGYVVMNGVKYACLVSTLLAESDYSKYTPYLTKDGGLTQEGLQLMNADPVPFTTTLDFAHATDVTAGLDKMTAQQKEQTLEEFKQAQAHDPDYTPFDFKIMPAGEKPEGVQEIEANIPLYATDTTTPSKVDSQGTYYSSTYVGLIKLRFSFDPQAGNGDAQTYEINKTVQFSGSGTYIWVDQESERASGYITFTNKTADLSGVQMTVKKMDVYASGADLYVNIACPDTWSETDKSSFLNSLFLQIQGDGELLQYNVEGQKKGTDACIHLKMLPSEVKAIKTFGILPVLSHYTGYDGIPYVEGKPTRVKFSDITGWQTDSTELTDCALSFSLK